MRKSLEMVFTSFLIFIGLFVNGQVAKMIPPSPVAREFDKYIYRDVTMYNGMPEISIPIYELILKEFTIPISLNYHASGIKFNQISGQVGLGWTLNPRYTLSENIRGKVGSPKSGQVIDEYPITMMSAQDRDMLLSSYYNVGPSSSGGTFPPIDTNRNGLYDIIGYSIKDKTGFFVKKDNDIISLEDPNIKISSGEIGFVDTLSLIDENGNIYYFGNYNSGDVAVENITNQVPSLDMNTKRLLASQIVTPYNEVVRFNYEPFSYVDLNNYLYTAHLSSKEIIYGSSQDTQGELYYSTPLLSEIVGEHEKVVFHNVNGLLKKIDVVGLGDNVIVKTYLFKYDVDGDFTLLKEIDILSKDQEEIQKYTFSYHSGDLPSGYYYTFDDYGYLYAVQSSTHGVQHSIFPSYLGDLLLPYRVDPYLYSQRLRNFLGQLYFMDKQVLNDPVYYTLEKITYPTGGTTTFEFESNMYSGKKIEGLRVKKITSKTNVGDSNPITREFKYGVNENGNAMLNRIVSFQDFASMSFFVSPASAPTFPVFYGPLLGLANRPSMGPVSDGTPSFFYKEVAVYEYKLLGESKVYNGKTVYTYEIDNRWNSKSSPIGTNFSMNNSLEAPPHSVVENVTRMFSPTYERHIVPFARPRLVGEKMYRGMSTESLDLVESITYGYETKIYHQLKEIFVVPFVAQTGVPYVIGLIQPGLSPYESIGVSSYFDFGQSTVTAGSQLLKTKTVTNYSQDDTLINVTKYGFEYNKYHQLVQKKMELSDNNIIIERRLYPFDFELHIEDPLLDEGIKNLIRKSVKNKIIEKSIWVYSNDSVPQSLIESELYKYYSDVPVLTSVSKLPIWEGDISFQFYNPKIGRVVTDNRYNIEIDYLRYDQYGNLVESLEKGGLRTVYLWGYKGKCPIAVIKNASYQNVLDILGQPVIDGFNIATVTDEAIMDGVNVLRSHPSMQQAQISTYTYKPLIGLTSMTDPRGGIEYYRYDGFGRLKSSIDHLGNVLKTYRYNYQTQP